MSKHRVATPAHLAKRLAIVRKRIGKWKTAALLVTNRKDIHYLTGFPGDDSWAFVPSSGNVTIISDSRFEEQINRDAPHARTVMRKKGLSDEVAKLARGRVALQSAYVTIAQRKVLAEKIGPRKLKDVDDGMLAQRAVKDADEVALIRKALAIQQEAFTRTLKHIRVGMTEFQIAAYLEYQMRSLGADGTSFPSIVAVDANASLPHAVPGPRKVKRGSMILIDWGARYRGYCSDLTRVVAIGKMPAKIREIYKIVLDAQLAAIAAIAPGKKLIDIDKVARDVIVKAGYGEQFGHSLGHGIGLDIHESPTLSARSKGVLEPGHVVTVEPGIYLPGVGGVRIEDDVLVTSSGSGRASGGRVLSDLPKTLESAII